MSIAKATVTDTEDLTALVNSAYRGESSKIGWTSESHLLDGQRIDDLMMLAYLEDPNVSILKYVNDNNEIKGCVYLETKGSDLYLGMLTVSPWEQGNGIGKKLLAAGYEECKKLDCRAIVITVISSRNELIDWYQRQGFKATGEVRPFHADERFGIPKAHIELIVMEKQVV